MGTVQWQVYALKLNLTFHVIFNFCQRSLLEICKERDTEEMCFLCLMSDLWLNLWPHIEPTIYYIMAALSTIKRITFLSIQVVLTYFVYMSFYQCKL